MTELTTVAEKIAKLGTLMARARIERELGVRVEKSGTDYRVQHLNDKGEVRAVGPTSEWTWRIQMCLYRLADELASEISNMATTIAGLDKRSKRAEDSRKWAEQEGYDRALDAVRELYPDLDLSSLIPGESAQDPVGEEKEVGLPMPATSDIRA